MALVKYNNNSISAVTSASSIPVGALTHIKTLTASSSSTLSFVHGSSDVVLDGTYPIYKFEFINLHPASNDYHFMLNFSTDGGSNYNVTKTTTYFRARHKENDTTAELGYSTGFDVAQSTGDACIFDSVSNDSDASWSGEMFLFAPASTTFVKHFISRIQGMSSSPLSNDVYSAGYGNTTSAINGVKFLVNSGNIDAGTIKLYGIKDS